MKNLPNQTNQSALIETVRSILFVSPLQIPKMKYVCCTVSCAFTSDQASCVFFTAPVSVETALAHRQTEFNDLSANCTDASFIPHLAWVDLKREWRSDEREFKVHIQIHYCSCNNTKRYYCNCQRRVLFTSGGQQLVGVGLMHLHTDIQTRCAWSATCVNTYMF